ncbi:probable membrane-associated kinase regulator 3 [Euphorbia lathyris]|uniref:probable membrane-associated kinase regulator 3 n=1 Tax=Euphorbia lathyris TaxID=212925 RepID=UPI0033139CB5
MGMHKYSCSYSDEDYIDIELFSSPNFLCYSITSPSPTKDFEFQMCPFPLDKLPKTSPADELFYNGKLLPLHLPTRSKTLQNLLNHSLTPLKSYTLQNLSGFPTDNSVGNPDECFFQFSTEPLKKSNWSVKLKQSLLAQKLKASTAYFKSLFTKSGDEFSCSKATASTTVQPVSSAGEDHFGDLKYMKISKKSPFGEMGLRQRQHSSPSPSLSSSASSSCSSNSTFSFTTSNHLQLLKIKSSMSTKNSEVDNSIEGAIAYCKKSYEQLMCSSVVTCGDH